MAVAAPESQWREDGASQTEERHDDADQAEGMGHQAFYRRHDPNLKQRQEAANFTA